MQYVSKDNNKFYLMDVKDSSTIIQSLTSTGGELDILLDDSTHTFEDQIRIIKDGLPYVKSGGMIIIEDIYRNQHINSYYHDSVFMCI